MMGCCRLREVLRQRYRQNRMQYCGYPKQWYAPLDYRMHRKHKKFLAVPEAKGKRAALPPKEILGPFQKKYTIFQMFPKLHLHRYQGRGYMFRIQGNRQVSTKNFETMYPLRCYSILLQGDYILISLPLLLLR